MVTFAIARSGALVYTSVIRLPVNVRLAEAPGPPTVRSPPLYACTTLTGFHHPLYVIPFGAPITLSSTTCGAGVGVAVPAGVLVTVGVLVAVGVSVLVGVFVDVNVFVV